MEEGIEARVKAPVRFPSEPWAILEHDTLAKYDFFDGYRQRVSQEPEKRLMLAVLEDAVATYQKKVLARGSKGKGLFREARDWILEEDSNWLFSFENICDILGFNPNYIRQGLIRWKERQIQNKEADTANLGDLVSPERTQEGEGTLRSQDIEVLKAAANLSGYQNPPESRGVYSYISKVVEKPVHIVSNYLAGINKELGTHNLFSAEYVSLNKGILDPNELANGKLEDFIKKIETLSPDEKEVLTAYGTVALQKKKAIKTYVREVLKISGGELESLEKGIYSKLGTCNPAQLAVASYVLVKYVATDKQSSRLPDASSVLQA